MSYVDELFFDRNIQPLKLTTYQDNPQIKDPKILSQASPTPPPPTTANGITSPLTTHKFSRLWLRLDLEPEIGEDKGDWVGFEPVRGRDLVEFFHRLGWKRGSARARFERKKRELIGSNSHLHFSNLQVGKEGEKRNEGMGSRRGGG
ncbi:hypothetical protein EV1_031928 [Malus domestica]